MKIRYSLPIILIVIVSLTNCSVSNRIYRDGLFVTWNKKSMNHPNNKIDVSKKNDHEIIIKKLLLTPRISPKTINTDLIVSANVTPFIANSNKGLSFINAELCDTIILRDGSKINAKVSLISNTEIKYKRCSFLDGPDFVVNKNKVSKVKYISGQEEVFEIEKTDDSKVTDCAFIILKDGSQIIAKIITISNNEIKYKRCDLIDGPDFVINKNRVSKIKHSSGQEEFLDAKKTDSRAYWSLALAILGFFPLYFIPGLGITAVLLAKKALKNNDLDDKNRRTAKAGLIIGWIRVAILSTILLFIFILIIGLTWFI